MKTKIILMILFILSNSMALDANKLLHGTYGGR